ncbi:MAG: hypothetical protein K6T87_08400 [Roseiflexus sp.]|uniref:hypothetical protein n=1 Tax=Roseiflexus sp. TaxID=2562120 RepID=UPI0025E09861|nr:hypothetical protein [Roseiflexus sp.]MCL6540592.1 hypothetical protein [Roseiflexus sp.]
MNRIFLMLAILVATVSIGAAPQVPRIALAQEPTIDFIGQVTIPTSGNVKFPQIMGRGDTVHIAGSGGRGDDNFARYWRKSADGTLNFADPRTLGPATGPPNYANSDVTIAPNGRVYVIANNTGDQAIYLWSSSDGTSWNPDDRKTVIRGGGFRVYPHIAASNNRLWVVWNQDGRYRYRTTTDVTGGGGWTGTRVVSNRESFGHPSVAVSPDGSRMAVAYAISDGDIYVGIWNGDGFTERLVHNNNLYLADPTVAFGPDNRIWVAWRAVEDEVYVSRENDQGNFPVSRLLRAGSYGTVSISVDPQNLAHVFWVGNRGDGWKAYYARQGTDGSWGLRVADPGAFIVNGMGAVTVSDFAYGHGVTEYFGGSGLVTRYYLFRSQGNNCVAQTITIGNALPGTNPPVVRDPTVVGTLAPSAGCTPAEQRVVLNAQDANAPAAPWSGAYNVPITNLEQCVQTLHVQLRANNRAQFDPQWRSVTFIADPQAAGTPVDAAVDVMNPKMFGLIPPVFSPVSPAGDMMSEGASTGDPGYTRIDQMHLRIADIGDCTGIGAYNVLFDNGTLSQSGTITGTFASNLPLPPQVPNTDLVAGETLFKIQVFDRAGNSVTLPRRMVYDPPGTNGEGRPVMDLSQTDLTPDTNTLTILRSLIINTIVVTDNLYRRGESVPTRGYTNNQTPPNSGDATKQFWGLWIAVEYLGKGANAESQYPPLPSGGLTFDNLRWQPVEVPNAVSGARVRFNLFDGVLNRTASSPTNGFGPDLTKDGTYRVYVKALDGAGNASTATYSTTLRLDPGYEVPTIRLPIIRR